MSSFEDFVNTELPRRPTLLTIATTSYSGDPNAGGAPSIVKNCPAGTFYLRDTDKVLWRKKEVTAGTWEEMGTGGGGSDITDVKRSWSNITYYVDWNTGNDTNDGSVGAPFKTITHALEMLPTVNMGGTWIVNVVAGNYAESVKCPKFLFARDLYATNTVAYIPSAPEAEGTIAVQTNSWTSVTPTTGPGTGTFSSGTGRALTLTGAGWTVNDLQYKFLRVVSGGSWTGAYLPIESNTTDTIYLPYGNSALHTATFEIVDTNVNINGVSGNPSCWVGSSHSEGIINCVGLNFDTSIASGYLCKANRGAMKFVSCKFVRSSTTGGLAFNGGRLYLDRCLYSLTNGRPLIMGRGEELSITNSCLYGSRANAITSSAKNTVISYSVIKDQTSGVTVSVSGVDNLNFDNNTITNCGTILQVDRVGTVSITGTTITPSTASRVIEIGSYCGVTFSTASSIASGTTDGIRMVGRNSTLTLNGSITNCVNTAVNLSPTSTTPLPGMNFVDYAASNTMTGNGKDFSLDGSATLFKADVNAAPNTRITDLDYMNTIRQH